MATSCGLQPLQALVCVLLGRCAKALVVLATDVPFNLLPLGICTSAMEDGPVQHCTAYTVPSVKGYRFMAVL